MTQREFTKAYVEFKIKFPDFKNSFVLMDTKNEIHNATEGDAIQLIQAMIEVSSNNPMMYAVFLTVGEYLRSTLSQKEIQGLTKIHLEKLTKENVN
jgi:hypothetical protein